MIKILSVGTKQSKIRTNSNFKNFILGKKDVVEDRNDLIEVRSEAQTKTSWP